MATPQTTFSLVVTHVDVEGPFFVVYGHSDKNAMDTISQFIKTYTHHFDTGIGSVTNAKQITVGATCVGKYIDSVYYRIKVLSINPSAQTVDAFFIDFGNSASLKFADLRIVNLPKQSNFLAMASVCVKHVVSSAVLVAGKEETALLWIRPYVIGEETNVKVVDPRINAIELCFRSSGKLYSVSTSLVHKGYATPIGIPDQFYMYQNIVEHKIPVQQLMQPPPHPPSALTSMYAADSTGKPSAATVAGFAPRLQPVPPAVAAPLNVTQQDPKPQSDALLQGHVYQVVVSYVDEEDMTVVVHKKDDYDTDLRALIESINSAPVTPYQNILEPGAYVLARQSEGSMLLRAVVFGSRGVEDEVQVYFVDFGHKALVPLGEVYQLPPQFANQKSMAHRCHLANLELAGPWSKETRAELEEITRDKVLNMKILTSSLKTKRTVSLSFAEDNRSVVDVLIQQLKPLMFESVHIPKGHSVEVVISHALSASRFFVQLTANQTALESLMDQVQTHCEATLTREPKRPSPFTEEELISGNLPCCALFDEDARWYRAIITDYEPPSSVTVRYVDFGNESLVNISNILAIPRSLMKVRTQAVECSLAGHSSRRETDLEEAQFQELIAAHDYTFLMSIKMHLVGSILLVELWELESKNSVRHTLEAMVMTAQKAQATTPPTRSVKSSPDTVSPAPSAAPSTREEPSKNKNVFERASSTRDRVNSSDSSEARKPAAARTSGGDETRPGDRRNRHDSDASGDQRKPRFGDRVDTNSFGGADRRDGSRFGGADRKDGSRFGGTDKGDGSRFGGADKGDGSRFGGANRDGDSRPPRKPRISDENDRLAGGGNWDNAKSNDQGYSGENRFRSGGGDRGGSSWKSGGGAREERGGREDRGGGFKKREDFTSDNWGAAKSFDSNSKSFPPAKPEKPKLMDGYPAGGRVPILPALGALEPPRTVSVTHYESPLSFFVQLKDSHESFLQFMKGLQSDYIKRRPVDRSELAVGQHVMAQFTEDRALYRAEVLQTSPEIKVKFFDYGNEASVPSSKVWHLASEHCALPMQSIPCRLSNLESAVTEEAAVKTWSMDCLQFFAEDSYQMIIRGYDDQNKAEVDLSSVDAGLQVSTRLVEAGLCKLVSSEVTVSVEDPVHVPLLLKQTVAVHIAYIETSRRFFVHVEPDKPDLIADKILELMAKPDELFTLTPDEVTVGKFVLATPDSECWYRARVTGRTEAEATVTYTVTFIDYGDSADVTVENIRDIPESVCDWCPQAIECYLTSASQDPLDEALETEFAENQNDVNATVLVTGVDDTNRLSVVLYTETGTLQKQFHPNLPEPALVPESIAPLCPYPVLRQGEKVFISHAAPDALYLQKISNEAAQGTFAADLHAHYAGTELPALESPAPGDIVATKSDAFDAWYRSRVESVDAEAGLVTVLYVDYGNAETVPLGNLRALDATHFYPPAYSLRTTFPATFLKDSYEIFSDIETAFDAVYARTADGKDWVVNLIALEGTLLEKHVLSGQLEVGENPFVEQASVVDRWIAQGPTLVTVMSFESPGELSISLQQDESAQEELQTRLQAFADSTMPILGECQELCLGKYAEDDQWYRALVLDAEFRALFVDYGNKDIVPEIRKLSHALRQIPPLSVKCALPLVPTTGTEWCQEAIDRLDTLVSDKTPKARILDYDTVPSVELILEDGKSVADVLVAEKLAARKSYKVVITHVNGPEDFFVQYVDNTALDNVFKVMEVIESNAAVSASQVQVGDILAAKYSLDEAWYRAKVMSKEAQEGNSTASVMYIDFGNSSEASEFRRLPSSVSKLPPLAKQCALALPPDSGETWPETAKLKLEEIANEGADEFELKWMDSEKNIVALVNAKAMDVAAILFEPPPLKTYMLTHINSANDFFLQDVDDAHIGTITELLAAFDSEPPLDSIPTDDLIAAKFVEDGAWYRARLVSTDPTLQVLFVDYGNTSAASEFRALSEPLKAFQPAAIHCCLALPDGASEYSQAATYKFIELSQAGETLYTCDFLPAATEGGLRPACLYISEDSVADLLASVPATTETQVPATTEVKGDGGATQHIICWVNSPDDFYVQKANDSSLDAIADLVAPVAEEAAIDVKPGDTVVAQFVDDEGWYRSRVLRATSEEAAYEVLFLDYGNSAQATAFRALPEALTLETIPPCAKQCRLAKPGSVQEWPADVTEVLNEWMNTAREVELEVVEERGGVSSVELVDGEGKRLSALAAGETEDVGAEKSSVKAVETSQPNVDTEEVAPELTICEPVQSEVAVGDIASPTKSSSPSKEASPSKNPQSPVKEDGSTSTPTKEVSPIQSFSPSKGASPTSTLISPTKESSPTKTMTSLKEKARASEAQKVYVLTHVNSPSDFYLMIDAETTMQIGQLLKGAADFEKVHSVILGSTYAAFSEREDSWHRVQLLEEVQEEAANGQPSFIVKYKDLGSTDIVTKDLLRELPEDLREMPDAVMKCMLDTPDDFILWSEPAVRELGDMVVTGQFYIDSMSEGQPARVVLRTTDGVNVNDMLLKLHQETKERREEVTDAEDMNETLNDTILSDAPSKNLVLQRVILSHYNSPDDFYVQVTKDRNILESVNSLLESLKPVDVVDVKPGEIYAAQQSNGDLWFRARALQPQSQTGCLVRRIDYGDVDTCGAFKQLSEDLSHISPLAHHCSVKDAMVSKRLAEWSQTSTELLVVEMEASTASNEPVVVVLKETTESAEPEAEKVNGDSEPAKANGVETTISNGGADSPVKTDETTPIKEVGKASTPVISPTQNGDNAKSNGVMNTSLDDTFVSCVSDKTIMEDLAEVYIMDINTIADFYVHLETDTSALEKMGEALQEVTAATHPLVPASEVKLNEIYVCKYSEDELFYRGRVVAKIDDGFRVLFVDYGNSSEVKELHQCPVDIRSDKIAPIAKHCEFVNPGPEGARVDLSPSGVLGKQFKALDPASLNLRLKSMSPVTPGSDKFAVEVVMAETGENLLAYLASLGEDVDK